MRKIKTYLAFWGTWVLWLFSSLVVAMHEAALDPQYRRLKKARVRLRIALPDTPPQLIEEDIVGTPGYQAYSWKRHSDAISGAPGVDLELLLGVNLTYSIFAAAKIDGRIISIITSPSITDMAAMTNWFKRF